MKMPKFEMKSVLFLRILLSPCKHKFNSNRKCQQKSQGIGWRLASYCNRWKKAIFKRFKENPIHLFFGLNFMWNCKLLLSLKICILIYLKFKKDDIGDTFSSSSCLIFVFRNLGCKFRWEMINVWIYIASCPGYVFHWSIPHLDQFDWGKCRSTDP